MGPIELLNPKGLFLLTGLVPLVVLYILKIKRTRLKVPSTWLWAEARRDLLAKHPFKKLIPELPLFLQILALIALSLALARPALRGGRITGDHVAIVIDTSASMGTITHPATGKTSTRIVDAVDAAKEVLARMDPGADAIIIEGAREAKVVSPLDRDLRRLSGSLSQVGVREVEGDLSAAVALAADRLRNLGGRKRIVVITDGALAKEGPLAAAGMETQIVSVGANEENAAITRIDVRAGTDPATKKEQAQVFVMVQSFGTVGREVYVTLTVDGKKDPSASRKVFLKPGAKEPVVLTFEPGPLEQGKGLVVQLSPGDALGIDDVAYGRVPQGRKMPVTLASNDDYTWVMRALEADEDVDLQKLTIAQLSTVNIDPEALVIVEGGCPDTIPGADVVVFHPAEKTTCMGVEVDKESENPQVTSWENGDPRFRFLTFDGVHIAKATGLKTTGSRTSLLRAQTMTLVADASTPGRSATIVGFDVGATDWPLRASFVLFVRNVVEVARLHRSTGSAGPSRTGDPLRVAVPKDVATVKVDGPQMPEHEVAAKGGFAVVPPVDKAGVYHARWTTPRFGNAVAVVNLTSERESDIRSKPITVDSTTTTTSNAARLSDAHQEWALWLALAAAAFIAFDVWWLTRKRKLPTKLKQEEPEVAA